MKKPIALSIAGSDSGAGAGVQADLKTFSALNIYGVTVITSVTSQNTKKVQDSINLPTSNIKSQIQAINSDFNLDAIKIGMLNSKEIIKTVSSEIKDLNAPIILDPVMVAESGDALIKEEAINSLKNDLFGKTELVTPNKSEAEKLSNKEIKSKKDIRSVCENTIDQGAKNVLITGGHLAGDDYFFDGKNLTKIPGENLKIKSHGSGCTHSSAIASFLAKGNKLIDSIRKAKNFTNTAIKKSQKIGKGNRPVNQFYSVLNKSDKFKVLFNIKKALNNIEEDFYKLIPEVGTNVGMATKFAENKEEIAAIPGRIVSKNTKHKVVGCPSFESSDHIARLILKVKEFDDEIRAAANIKFSEDILEKINKLDLTLSSFKRESVPEKDTMSHGAEKAIIKNNGVVPDIIYDEGGVGKEPMIRVFGKKATDVVEEINQINKLF